MAIEWRKGRPYYYRKVWKDGTCLSEYCGLATTDNARLWMGVVQLERERRTLMQQTAAVARAEISTLARTPPDVQQALAAARQAVAAALTAAGYHQHKRGEWRKRRGTKDKDTPAAG